MKNESSKKKKKSSDINKSMTTLIPIREYDENLNCFVYEDGTLMDLIQIKAKDLKSISTEEIEFMNMKFSKWYKKYADDLKLIMMNFPSDTIKQQQYWNHKLKVTKNPIFKAWQEKKLLELDWVGKNRTSREFFLMHWGKNKDQFLNNRELIVETLGTGKMGYISYLKQKKKQEILFKYNNQCSIVYTKEEE